jgi:nucleoside transporter
MNTSPRPKLFIMMVLEFFIWGAWLPLIWGYMGKGEGALGFTDGQIALVGSAFAIASILAIFFSNQFADRKFAAEKFMAASHLIGGIAMLGLYFATSFPAFFALMLVHSIFYVPTISVANSLAFANLKDPTREFGPIRMGGTIGWILASWPLYFLLAGKSGADAMAATKAIFLVSGIASLVLAAFSLTLPHTPPKKSEDGDSLAWLKAGRLLLKPFILVLFIVTFIDATIHNGYFLVTGGFLENRVGFEKKWVMPIMSLGQVAEILTMLVLGLVLKKLGWKLTLIVGILGHAARFAIYAFFPDSQPLIILVQLLHGICYAFFFAAVYIFIDAAFPKDVRASAQGWFNLLILGIGDLAAKWFFIPLQGRLTSPEGVTDFQQLFLWPTGLALGAAVLLAIGFNPPREIRTHNDAAAPAH